MPNHSNVFSFIRSASKLALKNKGTYLLTAFILAAPLQRAQAEETTSRYTMIESKNGIIRLDKKTGALSNCKKTTSGWTCQPIKETNEIDQQSESNNNDERINDLKKANKALEKENQVLKQRIANLELGIKETPSEKNLKLPSDEEVDEAITYMEKMIRKFGGAMKRLREKQPEVPGTEL